MSPGENISTDLSPNMRMACKQILGIPIDYDANQQTVIDIIKDIRPDGVDVFTNFLRSIYRLDCQNKLVPIIESMSLEGLNIKDMDPNEFAERYIKILNQNRAKIITKPKGKNKVKQKKKDHMKKLYHMYHRDKGYKEKESYNLIKEKHYPQHAISTIKSYIKK